MVPRRVAGREKGECDEAEAVAALVSHNDHAGNGACQGEHHGNPHRPIELRGRARAVGEAPAAARERSDNAKRRREPDAVVAPVGHNDHATRRDYSNSARPVELRGRARAVGEAPAAARERSDNAARVRHEPDAVVVTVGHNNGAA